MRCLQQEVASEHNALQRDHNSSSNIAAGARACPARAAHALPCRTTCSEAFAVQHECRGAFQAMTTESACGAYAAMSEGAASLRCPRLNLLKRDSATLFCSIRWPHYKQARHNALW